MMESPKALVGRVSPARATARCWFRSVAAGAFLLVLLGAPLTASAQTFGIRAGASVDPDQFVFGFHYETSPLVDRLHFRPNLEVGVGDESTLVTFNIEFAYHFQSRQPWHVYAGGGPALVLTLREGEDHTGGGFNLLVGIEHRRGLFGEVKVGTIDSPDLKLTVGYIFR
jgi:hypothetical protein